MCGTENHSLHVLDVSLYLTFGLSPKTCFSNAVGGNVSCNVLSLYEVKYCSHCVFYLRDMGELKVAIIVWTCIKNINNAEGRVRRKVVDIKCIYRFYATRLSENCEKAQNLRCNSLGLVLKNHRNFHDPGALARGIMLITVNSPGVF